MSIYAELLFYHVEVRGLHRHDHIDRIVQAILGQRSAAMTGCYQQGLPAMLSDAGARLAQFLEANCCVALKWTLPRFRYPWRIGQC